MCGSVCGCVAVCVWGGSVFGGCGSVGGEVTVYV